MFDIKGMAIECSRQDTGMFTITFTGDDAPQDGTVVLVSLKTRPKKDAPVIWEKHLEVYESQVQVHITREDSDLAEGAYWWDARILFDDSEEPFTPMEPAPFRVLEVVGNV